MWAHLDWFDGGCIRVFDDGVRFGEPFNYAVPFKLIQPDILEIVGVWQVPTKSQYQAGLQAIVAAGYIARRERKSGANPGLKTFR